MTDESSELAKALDQIQIFNVRRAWAFSLDLGEWDRLRSCFHPDASITVSWYSGPLDGFIDRSRALMASRKPEEHRKHWLGNMRSEINGTRAVLETDVLILIREFIDATLFDYTSYARFYDLLEKRAGVWRIVEWNCIYDKDRLDPVAPPRERALPGRASGAGGAGERVCIHEAATIQTGPNHPGINRDPGHRRRTQSSPAGRNLACWHERVKCRCESYSWAPRTSRSRR